MKIQELLKASVLICILGLSTGCSTLTSLIPEERPKETPIQYDDFSDVGEVEFIPVPVYEVGNYPPASLITINGKDYAAFDKHGILALMELKAKHEHNTVQLKEANKLLEVYVAERNLVYSAGLDLQNKYNVQAEKTELCYQDLSAEKRKNFISRWLERGIFGGILFLVVQ